MTMRKLLPSLLATCVHMWACEQPVARKERTHTPEKASNAPSADTMIPASDTVITNEVTSWSRFEDYTGRYAGEVDLLEKAPLKQRFRDLLGRDTAAFMRRYQVAPPIEVEGGILFNEGCRPHHCASDEAALAIDMNRDIIYAGIAIDGKVKIYAEKGDTAAPQPLKEWQQKFARRP